MENNWPKAIEITVAILGANIVGAILAFALDSVWPMVVVVVVCSASVGYIIIGNALREWKLSRLQRKARTWSEGL